MFYRERYERFIEKVEHFELEGGLEHYDMHAGHWYAFMNGAERIDGRLDSIYRAYKFGMLQALRFASKHSREECAEIVRGADQ